MGKLFTREQARAFLRDNNLKDAPSIESALIAGFKELLQEALEAEMDNELGYSKYNWKNKDTGNSRNGHTKKTVRSNFGEVELNMPRDTDGEFEPVIVKKHERQVNSKIEESLISFYAKGMSERDISFSLEKIYGVELSAETISHITDKVLPIAKEWRNRSLNAMYPIVYLDGIMFNVRQDGQVVKKTVYLIYGIDIDGRKDVLGMWLGEAESSKFWMSVLVDLKNRGVKDILIAVVDGLNGFAEAIKAVFPKTEIQRCIVHQIRNSTKFVSYKDIKEFCANMKNIYTAANEKAGLKALDAFEERWNKKYPYAIKSWRAHWAELSTFFKYPPEIRKIIYTTNPIESLNRRIRKVTKTKSSFPTDDSLIKLLYLVVMDASGKWTMPARDWGAVINQLRIYFGDRMDAHLLN